MSIADLLDELEADASVTTYFSSTAGESDGYAVVTINPEEEISVVIQDGRGRTVASAILDPTDQTSPVTSPITWSTTVYDATPTITGFGAVHEVARRDALNHIVRSRSDGGGRTIEIEDAENNDTTYEYDNNGNQIRVRDPNSVGWDAGTALGTFNGYDNRNRLTDHIDTQGDKTSTGYDQNNNVVSVTDAKSEDSTCRFDARDRRFECTDRLDCVINWRFDESNNLIRLTDAESQQTNYEYNLRNLEVKATWPDHVGGSTPGQIGYGITEVTYDAAQRPELATDQQGDTCTYNYDLANRLTQKDYRLRVNSPSGTIADSDVFTFDDATRMLTAVSGRYTNTCTMVYDDASRLTSEQLTTHGFNFTCSSQYDAANRRTRITYPDSSYVDREYTDRNQLERVKYTNTPAGGTLTNFQTDHRVYDLGMRLTTDNSGNGVSSAYTYRSDNLTSTIVRTGVSNFVNGSNGLDFTYGATGYDANKNKLNETITTPMNGYGFGTTTASTYDKEDRLLSWTRDDTNLNESWTLSCVGDWTQYTQNLATETRTHPSAHELTLITGGGNPGSLTYDAKGNLLTDGTRTPNAHSYTWDFDNQLMGASVDGVRGNEIEYTYDALGRRVSKTFPVGGNPCTIIFVCSGPQVLAEYKWEPRTHDDGPGDTEPAPGGDVTNSTTATNAAGTSTVAATATITLLRKYQYTTYVDDRCVMVDLTAAGTQGAGTEELFWYHTNNLFSVAALTDINAAIVERYAYDAYGNTSFLDGASTPALLSTQVSAYGNEYCYTGQRLDAETGLYHYKRRYYAPALGRFISRDPILNLNLNLYEYVEGAPLKYVDPSGESAYQVETSRGRGEMANGVECQERTCMYTGIRGMHTSLGALAIGYTRISSPMILG